MFLLLIHNIFTLLNFKETLSYFQKAVINRALTHTHPHPTKKRSHSFTPTHTKPRKDHTHPHPPKKRSHSPTPTQKKVTLTHIHPHPDKKGNTQPKKGHTHPHITEINNVACLTHTSHSLFTILVGVFSFEKD